ncbi:hypothetical protein Tco_0747195 [Tanacetum coccineum]
MPTIEEGEVIEEFRTRDEDLDTGIDDYPSYCDDDKKIRIDYADNLKFSCMIGFEFTHVNFFLLLYVNVMSKKFHNSIMKDKMVYKGDNVVGALMNVPIIFGTFSVMTDFAVLEDMDAYHDERMGVVIVGEPFLREVGIKARRFDGMIIIYNGDDEGKGSTVPVESHPIPTSAPSTSQPPTTPPSMQTTHDAEEPATMPHDSSHPRVQSLGSDEGSLILNELMVLCTTLSKKVEDLQSDLKQTKLNYGAAYTKLIMRVKKDENFKIQEMLQIQGRTSANTEILLDQEEPTELVEDLGSGEKGEKEISTDNLPVSTASAIPKVSTAGPSLSTADVFEDEMMTIAESLVAIRRTRPRTTSVVIHDPKEEPRRTVPEPTAPSHSSYKDKGKEKMIEPDEPVKIKRRDQSMYQVQADAELA